MSEPNHIKEAIEKIHVPEDELNAILTIAFKKKPNKKISFKKTVSYISAAAIISFCMISSAYVSPAFAKFMTQIPVIGEAFDHFILQEEYYQAYEDISTDIGLLTSSKGIDIIIEKAFYDGSTVTLSYIIKSDRDLGSFPTSEETPLINGQISTAGAEGEFVEGVGHVGMMTLQSNETNGETVNVTWEPRAIMTGQETINGDWKFAFSLHALPGTYIPIHQQVSTDGVTVELLDAVKTEVNLTVNYLQDVRPSVLEDWLAVEAELTAVDNLGNAYEVPYNGGEGTKDGDTSEDLTWNATVHGLDSQATSITFYPFAHVSNSQSDFKRIDFEPITVSLK